MSFSIRTNRHHETPTTRSRKVVITLLVLLSLFLLGTVIVLSSVSYYLAIPSTAYLTEEEVPWRTTDAIQPLKYRPDETSQQHRRQSRNRRQRSPSLPRRERRQGRQQQERDEWDDAAGAVSSSEGGGEPGVEAGILGADEIADVWEQLEPVGGAHGDADMGGDEVDVDELNEVDGVDMDEVNSESAAGLGGSYGSSGFEGDESDASALWDVDGRGTGGYWMRKDWDGRVEGTDSWERLFNVSTRPGEKIPRLIHQTWKDSSLPPKWRKAWKECREGMADYDYMLWTDDLSRSFIATHYPAHLHMFDSYKYPIQRADSIRYFVLHHFGGIYMDLDIGCRRRLDSLLQGDWEVILPLTKPVGVSNDLIFSAKGSAFMDDTVHALAAWNHEWLTNYPTVMFSTGPMFLSGQYSIYTWAHPITPTHPRAEVRILPKSLYGKNIAADLVPHSFFSHFYGSSWHADDAGFITFLGSWGKGLMYVGGLVLVGGLIRLLYLKSTGASAQQYQLLSILPTSSSDNGPSGGLHDSTSSNGSPTSSTALEGFEAHPLPHDIDIPREIASVFRRAGNLILAAPATLIGDRGDRDRRGRRKTGLLYFVPAMFQPGPLPSRRGRTASEASQLPLRRTRRTPAPAPPPYERVSSDTRVLPPTLPALAPPVKVQPLRTGHGHGHGGTPPGLERDTDGEGDGEGEGMEEVDAFLKESWAGSSTEGEEYDADGEREHKGWGVWKERQ